MFSETSHSTKQCRNIIHVLVVAYFNMPVIFVNSLYKKVDYCHIYVTSLPHLLALKTISAFVPAYGVDPGTFASSVTRLTR